MGLAVKQTKIAKLAVLGGLALALGGCVGEGEYSETQQRVIDRADAMDAQLARVNTNSNGSRRFNTSFGAMPDSGQVRYNGHALVVVDRIRDGEIGQGDFLAVGVGHIDVDFSGVSDFSGVFSEFLGSDSQGQGQAYSGYLGLVNGEVGATWPNDFSATAVLDLSLLNLGSSTPNESYEIFTTVTGDFVGTPIYGVRGVSGPGTTALVDGNVNRS